MESKVLNKAWKVILAASFAQLVAADQSTAELSVEGAWVRALPPTQSTTAAYLTLVNGGAQSVEVASASAEIAGRVEFHTTREVDGYVRMEQLPGLSVPAGQSLALAPGGAHLMLLELARMPAVGETVRLCLRTASDQEICTDAEVRKSGLDHSSHQHHH